MFRSAPKAVQDAAVKLHYPDPCGDNYSLIDTIQQQAANVGKVKVPVLVVCGTQRRAVRRRSAARPRQSASRRAAR